MQHSSEWYESQVLEHLELSKEEVTAPADTISHLDRAYVLSNLAVAASNAELTRVTERRPLK